MKVRITEGSALLLHERQKTLLNHVAGTPAERLKRPGKILPPPRFFSRSPPAFILSRGGLIPLPLSSRLLSLRTPSAFGKVGEMDIKNMPGLLEAGARYRVEEKRKVVSSQRSRPLSSFIYLLAFLGGHLNGLHRLSGSLLLLLLLLAGNESSGRKSKDSDGLHNYLTSLDV